MPEQNEYLGFLKFDYNSAFVIDLDVALDIIKLLGTGIEVEADYGDQIKDIKDKPSLTLKLVTKQQVKEARLKQVLLTTGTDEENNNVL